MHWYDDNEAQGKWILMILENPQVWVDLNNDEGVMGETWNTMCGCIELYMLMLQLIECMNPPNAIYESLCQA